MSDTNPFLKRAARTAKQSPAFWRAPKQEKQLANRFGARQVSRSGAGTKKGDLYIDGILRLEAKATSQKSFTVSREMYSKISNAALACGELPCLIVEFLSPTTGKPEAELAIVSVEHLKWLIHNAAKTDTTPGS